MSFQVEPMNKHFMQLAPVLCLLSIILNSPANAITYREYKAAKASNGALWQATQAYFQGVREGFSLANLELRDRHEPMLYCQPPKLSLNDETLIQILEESINRVMGHNGITEDSEIEAALLFGLKYTFPCDAAKPK